MMAASCPNCKEKISLVNVEPLNGVTVPNTTDLPSRCSIPAYLCHACNAVLGVSPNPNAMVVEITRRLGGPVRGVG
jgi:hypothetical protein